MATADEILATMAEEAAATDQTAEVCTIDRCTRAVTIPEALRIVGVETDKDVTRRHFKVLCSYRGTNLSTFRIRIHFMNANKEKDIYYVTDAAQDGEYLTFSWVISRNATKYKGKLKFIACMVCDGGTDEEREWNSTLGEFTVLEGLEVELTDGEEEQARDAITQLLAVIDARESEAVEAVRAAGAETIASIPKDYTALSEEKVSKVESIHPDHPTLFDQRNVIHGYWYDWATGEIAESSDRFIQPFVPCEPSTVYAKAACNVSMYDANKAYISTVAWSDTNTFTTPENAAYFGVSMTTADIAAVKLVKGDTVPATQPVTMLSPSQVVGLPDAISAANNSFQFLGQGEAGNYATLLPDANNAGNGFYILNFPWGSEDIPANLPIAAFTGRMDLLESYVNKDGYRRQIYYHYHNAETVKVYSRGGVSPDSWDEWELVVAGHRAPIIVDKNGGGDYTSLTQAMRENVGAAYEFHVRPGTYDLFEEMQAFHGADYFDNSAFFDEGLAINHGVKVFLDANAIVKFDYTGSNSRVIEYFSPFKFSGVGGELHGGQIVCSNCRYAIHDDCYTSAYDNRVTDGVYIYYRSDRDVAIGGGLGISSHVELKNCYVDSGDTGYGVFYHNNSESDEAQNFVSIHDNYFTAGVVIESLGPSPLMSKAIVSNNKAEYVKHVQPSVADNPPNINNFEMIAWNNETVQ